MTGGPSRPLSGWPALRSRSQSHRDVTAGREPAGVPAGRLSAASARDPASAARPEGSAAGSDFTPGPPGHAGTPLRGIRGREAGQHFVSSDLWSTAGSILSWLPDMSYNSCAAILAV